MEKKRKGSFTTLLRARLNYCTNDVVFASARVSCDIQDLREMSVETQKPRFPDRTGVEEYPITHMKLSRVKLYYDFVRELNFRFRDFTLEGAM